ncbi:C-5 cytosine methyltransferase [uncultured Caudovirales phage]|uniref:Cytosine-specific methyltransferase n=1 Tax=uncultured Caudovirales phage TaxID=2100421 RepID=A0A6J5P6J6_9CAUD|nr:C-5 cytosine methyltransferase [uncultured Caudovirales phage]CAB4171702.1 C-5 cytosine methyltransferase [uncultured Caudovirales phage]CAB4177566.1 C-5 cytosine methyltransferase [uncultured Caudovirales phage]CAB4202005.1 C-5 cytosine methyltransferase [uncultured Caudovirales phage]
MRVLDLFSGIGGFSLGLERAGMETVAFCEIDAKARLVLKKHWPKVPIYEDVSTLKGSDLHDIDVICGGFPCQDISLAGRGAGLEGERSGLWFQFHRLIKEIQPRYAVIENVSALRSRGLDQVLRSLAEIGYDAEWHCIPASAVGAPHRRDRIWIVAYPSSGGWREGRVRNERDNGQSIGQGGPIIFTQSSETPALVANPDSAQCEGRRLSSRTYAKYANTVSGGRWEIEPSVGRVANGLPGQSHRLKQLGNAVVPQIPELIGRAIMEHENAT